jgi:hypothetical protein
MTAQVVAIGVNLLTAAKRTAAKSHQLVALRRRSGKETNKRHLKSDAFCLFTNFRVQLW